MHTHNRIVLIAIGVFLLVVAGMFSYTYLKRGEMTGDTRAPDRSQDTPGEQEERSPYAGIERIDATHFFEDGTHTVVGEINMPTPCDLLDPRVEVAESMPEQVTINFEVINNSATCAQVITPQRFRVDFDASEDASVSATLDGRELPINLIPAKEGESPDDFEQFIKG